MTSAANERYEEPDLSFMCKLTCLGYLQAIELPSGMIGIYTWPLDLHAWVGMKTSALLGMCLSSATHFISKK